MQDSHRSCSSCNAPIIWAVTEAGRRMPVDAQEVIGGNVVVEQGVVPRAKVVAAGQGTHQSHFASCPAAAQHRRKR